MNKLHLLLLLMSFILPGSSAYAANSPVVKDGSIDGGARILQIHCPSGVRTTVRLYIDEYKQYRPGMTCIYKADGSDICRDNWDHDEAAVAACDQ